MQYFRVWLIMVLVVVAMAFVPTASAAVEPLIPWGSNYPTLLQNPTNGQPTAVWRDAGDSMVYISYFTESSWSTPSASVYADLFAAAYTPSGDLVTVVAGTYGGVWDLYRAVNVRAGDPYGWELVHIGTTAGLPSDVKVLVSPSGVVNVLWQVSYTIWQSRENQDGWSYPVRVAYGIEYDAEFGPNGTLHLVCSNNTWGNYDVHYVFLRDGFPKWSLATKVATSGNARKPKISVGAENHVYITWQDDVGGERWIYQGDICESETGFCFAPLSNARGIDPNLLSAASGLWFIWQDIAPVDGRHMVLIHYPGEQTATVVDEPTKSVQNPRLEEWGSVIRMRWEDSNNMPRYCDGWLEGGVLKTTEVKTWPPSQKVWKSFCPLVENCEVPPPPK